MHDCDVGPAPLDQRKRHQVDPSAGLKDIMKRRPTDPSDRLGELLPDVWIAAYPDAPRRVASRQITESFGEFQRLAALERIRYRTPTAGQRGEMNRLSRSSGGIPMNRRFVALSAVLCLVAMVFFVS